MVAGYEHDFHYLLGMDPSENTEAETLLKRLETLNSPLDSKELKEICDYRTYFHYDIRIKETDNFDEAGNPVILSLSRVLREKSGGESQPPYYVAIAASFYRHFRADPQRIVRLVIFGISFPKCRPPRNQAGG